MVKCFGSTDKWFVFYVTEKAKPWGNRMDCGAGIAAAFFLDVSEAQTGKRDIVVATLKSWP